MNDLRQFIFQLMNGLDSIKLPLLGFTDLSLWDFLLGLFIISFLYGLISLLLHKGGD